MGNEPLKISTIISKKMNCVNTSEMTLSQKINFVQTESFNIVLKIIRIVRKHYK